MAAPKKPEKKKKEETASEKLKGHKKVFSIDEADGLIGYDPADPDGNLKLEWIANKPGGKIGKIYIIVTRDIKDGDRPLWNTHSYLMHEKMKKGEFKWIKK